MKKSVSFLLVVALLLSMFSGAGLVRADTVSGLSGSGMAANPYLIQTPTAKNLCSFEVQDSIARVIPAADENPSEDTPKPIESAEDLAAAIQADPSGSYVLANDFTVSDGWTPLGTQTRPFSGSLDGAGHKITLELTYSDLDSPFAGLFGVVSGAISNLTVDGSLTVTCKGGIAGGIVAALTAGGSIDCSVSNVAISFTADEQKSAVGGIVGDVLAGNSSITGCTNHGTLTVSMNGSSNNDDYLRGVNYAVGGILGTLNFQACAEISECINAGELYVDERETAAVNVGGIVGQISSSGDSGFGYLDILRCGNKADITVVNYGGERAAGIAGYVRKGRIVSSYNWGDISVTKADGSTSEDAGGYGIFGYSNLGYAFPQLVLDCYSASETPMVGAEICRNNGDASYLYFRVFLPEGRTAYRTKAGIQPGITFEDAAELLEKLQDVTDAYVENPDGGYPVLAFELTASEEAVAQADAAIAALAAQPFTSNDALVTAAAEVQAKVGALSAAQQATLENSALLDYYTALAALQAAPLSEDNISHLTAAQAGLSAMETAGYPVTELAEAYQATANAVAELQENVTALDNKSAVTAVSGPTPKSGESYKELLDGDTGTKLCGGNLYKTPVVWKVESDSPVVAYTFTTGNDTQGSNVSRNPLWWTLSGSDDGESWTELQSVYCAELPNANYAESQKFFLPEASGYAYYQLQLYESVTLQISELTMYTSDHSHDYQPTVTVDPTVQAGGYTLEMCVECGAYRVENVTPAAELEILISCAAPAKSGAAYDYTWDLALADGYQDLFQTFNSKYDVVDYGVIVTATPEDMTNAGIPLIGEEETSVERKAYQTSFGTTAFSYYAYRRTGVAPGRSRYAVFYLTYQDAEQEYTVLSPCVSISTAKE